MFSSLRRATPAATSRLGLFGLLFLSLIAGIVGSTTCRLSPTLFVGLSNSSMRNFSWNLALDGSLGKALIGTLSFDTGFFEFVLSTKLGTVTTKFAFATIFRQTRLAFSTASHSISFTGVAFAASE